MIHQTRRPILYVDDTVEQRYAMRRILETAGFQVLEAGTGKEAMAQMVHAPALAVVDVRLPDVDGYELSKKLKAHQLYLPVLQVSASFSDPEYRTAGFSGDADAYIAQPVHPAELTSLVKRMLRTSEAEESLRFLAHIGPMLNRTLSFEEARENVRSAMIPFFCDGCYLYVNNLPAQSSPFWPAETAPEMETLLREHAGQPITLLTPQRLVAPLSTGTQAQGTVLFELNPGRQYTQGDIVFAADLASRIALTLQNCVLFASEQFTRNALIESEKLATAGRLSAAIAHEINNPLEALTNLIYIVEHSPEATDHIREVAGMALSEVTRLSHITRQTLGFYRELRAPSKFDLSQSVRDTVLLYERRIKNTGIALDFDLADEVIICGVPGEIRQVISNLIVNAIEALDGKGAISFQTRREGDNALLSICDTGPGIPDDIRLRIFEPFFTTKPGTGTGLGLWITHSIVVKHRGTIEVESHSDPHGTIFHLCLPLAES